MEIIINELSLSGQFNNKDEFLDNLEKLLPIFRLIDQLNFSLLKNHTFFSSKITVSEQLTHIIYSKNTKVRKFKSHLLKLANTPPYWNDSQIHSCINDTYTFNLNNICETSLAESSQRDKFILSFKHDDYTNSELVVQKNNINIVLSNIYDKNMLLESLYTNNFICSHKYCLHKFVDNNLDFSKIDENYGFNILDETQAKEFINTFNTFSEMSWIEIGNSDGLEYKPYKGALFQIKHSNQNICKFRITQKYRCFGYRKDDVFYVLRFETDHKISDHG